MNLCSCVHKPSHTTFIPPNSPSAASVIHKSFWCNTLVSSMVAVPYSQVRIIVYWLHQERMPSVYSLIYFVLHWSWRWIILKLSFILIFNHEFITNFQKVFPLLIPSQWQVVPLSTCIITNTWIWKWGALSGFMFLMKGSFTPPKQTNEIFISSYSYVDNVELCYFVYDDECWSKVL